MKLKLDLRKSCKEVSMKVLVHSLFAFLVLMQIATVQAAAFARGLLKRAAVVTAGVTGTAVILADVCRGQLNEGIRFLEDVVEDEFSQDLDSPQLKNIKTFLRTPSKRTVMDVQSDIYDAHLTNIRFSEFKRLYREKALREEILKKINYYLSLS